MKKLYLSQILVFISALLVCVSTVIPAAKLGDVSVSLLGSGGTGGMFIVLSLAAAVAIFRRKRKTCLIFSLLTLGLAILQYTTFVDSSVGACIAIGLYLMLAASILLLITSIFAFIQVEK